MSASHAIPDQRGMALVIVLMVTLALATLAAGLIRISRLAGQRAQTLEAMTVARGWLEGAQHLAVFAVLNQRLPVDGRQHPLPAPVAGVTMTVQADNPTRLIPLDKPESPALRALLRRLCPDPAQATLWRQRLEPPSPRDPPHPARQATIAAAFAGAADLPCLTATAWEQFWPAVTPVTDPAALRLQLTVVTPAARAAAWGWLRLTPEQEPPFQVLEWHDMP